MVFSSIYVIYFLKNKKNRRLKITTQFTVIKTRENMATKMKTMLCAQQALLKLQGPQMRETYQMIIAIRVMKAAGAAQAAMKGATAAQAAMKATTAAAQAATAAQAAVKAANDQVAAAAAAQAASAAAQAASAAAAKAIDKVNLVIHEVNQAKYREDQALRSFAKSYEEDSQGSKLGVFEKMIGVLIGGPFTLLADIVSIPSDCKRYYRNCNKGKAETEAEVGKGKAQFFTTSHRLTSMLCIRNSN